MKQRLKAIFTNEYLILTMLTALALSIRLLNIDKPYGLWYDEMLTYQFSAESFPFGIIKNLLRFDYHMPLYYLYVHVWMNLLGTDDTVLRCSSVFWGVLSVPAFYQLGKTFRSKQLGYLLAIVGCLSPILIYFSQELRFYSMLVFFATLSLIYFLKLLEDPNKKNLFFFGISNLIILYIYTMGIMFVGLEFLMLLIHHYKDDKRNLKNLVRYLAVFFILSMPYLVLFFSYMIASNQILFNPFGWYKQPFYTPILVINDLLSPVFLCLQGYTIIMYSGSVLAFALINISTCLFGIGFISSFGKVSKRFLYLLIIFLTIFFINVFLSLSDNLILSAKYVLIIQPIFLLLCLDGLLSIRFNFLKKICIIFILAVYVYNAVNYKTMASFDLRRTGEKVPAETLQQLQLNKNDYVLYIGGMDLFKKYAYNISYINLDYAKILYLDKKKQEAQKLFDEDFINTTTKSNSMEKFMAYFGSSNPTPELTKYMNSSINKIPKGHKLIFVDDCLIRYNPDEVNNFIKNYSNSKQEHNIYKENMYQFFYSKFYKDLYNLLDKNPNLKWKQEFETNGSTKKWHFTIYEKI